MFFLKAHFYLSVPPKKRDEILK